MKHSNNAVVAGVVVEVTEQDTAKGFRCLLKLKTTEVNRSDIAVDGVAYVYVVRSVAAAQTAISIQPGTLIHAIGRHVTNGERTWVATDTAPVARAVKPDAPKPAQRGMVRVGESFDDWNRRYMRRRVRS
jgi:hypothetical protein